MGKGKHLHTNFIKFLIEKHSQDETEMEEVQPEVQDENEIKKKKRYDFIPDEIDEDEDEPIYDEDDTTDEDDDMVIEKLLNEYRNLRMKYENSKTRRKK